MSRPKSSKVLTTTKSANVESSPPEIPITAFLRLVCSKRLAKAEAWILNISLHLSSLSCSFEGTKGCLSTYLSKVLISILLNLNNIFLA